MRWGHPTSTGAYSRGCEGPHPQFLTQRPESWLPDLYHLYLVMGRLYPEKQDQPKLKDQKIPTLAVFHQMAETDHLTVKPKVSKNHTRTFYFPFYHHNLSIFLSLSQSHVYFLSLFLKASILTISSRRRSQETSSVNPAWTRGSDSVMNSWPRLLLLPSPLPTLAPDCFDAHPRPHIILSVSVSLRISERL